MNVNTDASLGKDGEEPDRSWLTRTMKQLRHRVSGKNEKPARNEDWAVRQGMPRPSLSYYTDVEAQLAEPVGFPLLERRRTPLPAGGRSLPGAFPAEVAIKASTPLPSEVLKADKVVTFSIPIPSELASSDSTTNAQTPEQAEPPTSLSAIVIVATPTDPVDITKPQVAVPVESSPPVIDDVLAPTNPSNIVVVVEHQPNTRRSSVASVESLPLVSNSDTTRSPSPEWVAAPTNVELSNASTAVESASRSSTPIDIHQELLDSIDNFRFSHMVSTKALSLSKARNFHAMVDITCNNLFNAGWDLTRLYMIWCDIILDAPSAEVLEITQPWTRLSKELVAKTCKHMMQGITTYRFWAEQVEYSRAVPVTRNMMGEEFWRSFDAKLLEFDSLRLDDITSQVEVVMGRCLGMQKKGVTRPSAPSEQEGSFLDRWPSGAVLVDEVEVSSIDKAREGKHKVDEPESQETPQAATQPHAKSTDANPLLSNGSVHRPILLQKPASKSLPGFARPTKASLRASQLPVQNGKRMPNTIIKSDFQQLAARVRNVRCAQHASTTTMKIKVQSRASPDLQLKIKRRLKPVASSSHLPVKVTAEPHAQSEATTFSTPSKVAIARPGSSIKPPSKVPATMRMPLRSDSVHDKRPASTLPRNFSPTEMWATSPPIYSTTTIPLRVNALGSKSLRFARPRPGDAEDIVVKMQPSNPGEIKVQTEIREVGAADREKTGCKHEGKPGTANRVNDDSSGLEVWHDASDVTV
jgi:hypothetical protein